MPEHSDTPRAATLSRRVAIWPAVATRLPGARRGHRAGRGAGRAKPWRTWVAAMLFIALGLSAAGVSVSAGLTIRDLQASIASAQAHLLRVQALGATLSAAPFDDGSLVQLRSEVAAAEQDFRRAGADADRIAPAENAPGLGLKVRDARAVLDMAIVLSNGGRTVLDAAIPVLQGLKASLATRNGGAAGQTAPPPGPPLTTAQLVALQRAVVTFAKDLDQAQAARQGIHDQGAALGPSAAHLLTRYDQLVTGLSDSLDSAGALLAAAPSLLGTDHPAGYLIEILDETELRGGGGFMGNYGVATVTSGRIASVTVRDTYLLDGPYLAAHRRAFPAEYSWFSLAASMGLRDSNLSPDYPQNAQLAARIYREESGQSVTGVAAITPAFIARLLELTGPVVVPGYQVSVTSQNLIQTIHHYQFQNNDQGVPSSDGISSTRKHFTAVLGETVFGRLRTLPAGTYGQLLKIAQDGLKSKDLQLYVNDQGVQSLLVRLHLANTLQSAAASDDMLTLVDTNVGANKADLYVTQTASDEATIGSDGSVQHVLTLVYAYRPTGPVLGNSSTFADEVQIYVPRGSTLNASAGLNRVDAPHDAAGRTVYGGKISLAPYTTRTVVLRWRAPKHPANAYHLVIHRQAGSIYTFSIAIHLPSSSTGAHASPPLTLSAGQARYATKGPLDADLQLDTVWH